MQFDQFEVKDFVFEYLKSKHFTALTPIQKEVLTNLKKNREGKTTILIAHRISTIQNADIIMVLEDGTAAENGNHDSLMAKHGIYYDMFEKQQLEAIHGEAGKALIRQDHPAAKTGKEDA